MYATRAVSRDELIEQGVSPSEANRMAVRSSLQVALEASFEHWGRLWLFAVIILVLGMFAVLVWSQWIYDAHCNDVCDQPLALMLRLLYIITGIHVFNREIISRILCYNVARDGPVEPCRVAFFRRASSSAAIVWPVAGIWMLMHSPKCSAELKLAVQVIIIYYAAVALVVVILPTLVVTVMLFLIRRGILPVPSHNPAPDGFVDTLPTVQYDPCVFNDDGPPGTYPAACPICIDDFTADKPITCTPCASTSQGHAFHTECLRGWLQRARTCPLCRTDLTKAPGSGDPEAGMELQTP
mmetsp:Transcript_38264/g.108196  ORF Transcript_38264/g.108196 Transcript_38264/m.108196 type:complete len:297 (+) Transcript_38264:41-931(+)